MFDTMRIFTDFELRLEHTKQNKIWRKRFTQNKYLEHYYYNSGRLRLFYFPFQKKLFVEFSIPKFLYGNNAKMYYGKDFTLLRKKFKCTMISLLNKNVPDLSEWEVSRLDTCYNFICSIEEDKHIFIDIAKKTYNGHMKTMEFNTGAFFYNNRVCYKLYDKTAEMLQNGEDVKDWMKKIIRFEVTMRRKKIKNLLIKAQKKIYVKNVLSDSFAKIVLVDYLKKMRLDKYIMHKDVVMELIRNNTSKSTSKKLIDFIEDINTLGEFRTKEIYGKVLFYRRLKKLKELNISPFFSTIKHPIQFYIFIPKTVVLEIKYEIKVITFYSTLFINKTFYYEDGG